MNAESQLTELLYHTALKGAVVLVVALLAGLALRKLAAARRYALWITAVITLATLPIAMALLPAWHVLPKMEPELQQRVQEVEIPVEAEIEAVAPFSAVPAPKPIQAAKTSPPPARPIWTWNQVVEALPFVWLSVSVLMLLRLGWSVWLLHRLEKSLSMGMCDRVTEIAHEMGLKRVPRLLIGPADAVPMVWGVWRPRLLLPAGFDEWDADKQRAVLLHELAHVKRGDPLALWAAQWVKALHWFNPLAWLTLCQMRADQEHACDDTALRHGVRPSAYAQHLLDLSRHTRIAPGLALCALTITRSAPVESRVEAILDPKRRREALTPRWLVGVALFALSTALPVAMLHAIEGPKLRGRILDRNGVVLAESTQEKVRHYPLKALASHVIGYTGKAAPNDLTPVGRDGIEKTMNQSLQRGDDVTLTLDGRIQRLSESALAGAKRNGAIVILDVATGEVLALASGPSFDLNVFPNGLSMEAWDELRKDINLPLFARASMAEYPPGQAFRWVTAAAAQASGNDQSAFPCSGSVKYGGRSFHDWQKEPHGMLSLEEALVQSCNGYFYQLANAVGMDDLVAAAQAMGFGTTSGLPLIREASGYVPGSPENKRNRVPGPGDLANFGIGQGMLLATPLQQAIAARLIASAGVVRVPALIKGAQTTPSLKAPDLSKEQWELLRRSMKRVVLEGTGTAARSDSVEIAAATGTVQWRISKDQNLATLIGFAPYDQPRIAFAIVAEGRPGEAISGGKLCGPMIKHIVEEVLALPLDGSGEVLPIEDEVGAAHGKSQAAKAEFDARGDALKQEIEQAAPDAKTGFVLDEVSVKDGRVVLRGAASGMIQALQFRDKLAQIGEVHQIEWTFPVPKTLEDGKRVGFEALGVPSGSGRVHDSNILLKPEVARQWSLLQERGRLAHLPADARSLVKTATSSGGISFQASRASVLRWLRASMGESKEVSALETRESFKQLFKWINDCHIEVASSDGNDVQVTVWRGERRILIAPETLGKPAGSLGGLGLDSSSSVLSS